MDVHISIMYIYTIYTDNYNSNKITGLFKQRQTTSKQHQDLDLSDVINTHQINIGINCVKNVRIGSFSAPYFPPFGRNVSLLVHSECGKIRTRKTPNTDTFHAVISWTVFAHISHLWILNIFAIWNLFKVNNGNNRAMREICLEVTTKTLKGRHCHHKENIDVVLLSLLLTLNWFHTSLCIVKFE